MLGRRVLLGSIVVVSVVLTAVSLAWAAPVFSVSPQKGPAGTTVQATGSGFPPGPVEIRWGSHHGTLLETASGPDFSVQVTIPPAAPGTYGIDAAPADEHASASEVSAAFEVTGTSTPPGGEPPPAGGGQPPPSSPVQLPSSNALPPEGASKGARAKAVARCKRRYAARRASTRAKRQRLARKKRTCLRRAKRLPA